MTSSTKIPIPLEGKDFERKCVPLFAGLLADPNAKMVVRKASTSWPGAIEIRTGQWVSSANCEPAETS